MMPRGKMPQEPATTPIRGTQAELPSRHGTNLQRLYVPVARDIAGMRNLPKVADWSPFRHRVTKLPIGACFRHIFLSRRDRLSHYLINFSLDKVVKWYP